MPSKCLQFALATFFVSVVQDAAFYYASIHYRTLARNPVPLIEPFYLRVWLNVTTVAFWQSDTHDINDAIIGQSDVFENGN